MAPHTELQSLGRPDDRAGVVDLAPRIPQQHAADYEAVGELDSRLQTESKWKEQFREGIIYYLKDGKVRGVLLWNTWAQVDTARAIIGTSKRLYLSVWCRPQSR